MTRILLFTIIPTFAFFTAFSANNPIPLQDAINKGYIQMNAKGLGNHLGQCIEMTITSTQKKEIEVSIDAGMQLVPDDATVQSMVVTQDRIITLAEHGVKKINLFAMCTEQADGSPSEDDQFALGAMAEGNLLAVVKFLNDKKYHDQAGQHAVWCITDSADIGGIHDDANLAIAKELRMLVANLTGKIPPWYQTTYRIEPGVQETFHPVSVHADFRYKLTEDGVVTFGIYNEEGETVQTILSDHAEKAGLHIMRISFESHNLPKGKYFARVTNMGVLVEEKVFEL